MKVTLEFTLDYSWLGYWTEEKEYLLDDLMYRLTFPDLQKEGITDVKLVKMERDLQKEGTTDVKLVKMERE